MFRDFYCLFFWGRSVRPGEFCSGRAVELPALVLQLLGVGALNASLVAGTAVARELAASRGWSAPAPPLARRYELPPDGASVLTCARAMRQSASMPAQVYVL